LPSKGIGYPSNAIEMPENGELPVYPMTAIDEITTRTPDALFNGVAVVELIKSCVPNIKDPWSMPQTDLDAVLLAIKIATNGNKTEMLTVCPECKEENKYDVNMTSLLALISAGDYTSAYDIGADPLKIKLRPLSYNTVNDMSKAQTEVQSQLSRIEKMEAGEEKDRISNEIIVKMNAMTMDLVLESIDAIITPDQAVTERAFIQEFLQNCDKNVYDAIRNKTIELKKLSEVKPLKFQCIKCKHNYEQPFNINVSDFFD
jgi:hypothetical protein